MQSTRTARNPTILNVNDHDGARFTTTLMLRSAGFAVLEAENGATALQLADRLPDVMVLDVKLPDIDGFEVCRRIKENPRTASIKILHTSAAYVTAENRVQGLDGGADAYLSQPFESEELIATVRSLVRLSHAEHELRAQADRLVDADRRKDEFLAMLAHELRNPLAAISASLPLLQQRDPFNSAEARARDVVGRQVAHLGRLVDDLLDVARVTSGKIVLKRDEVDLTALLSRAGATLKERSGYNRGVEIQLDLGEDRVIVEGDAVRLEQVFTNLLDNALKYNTPGGRICVGLRVEAEGRRAIVSVQDTGVGIAPEALPRIFELFSQADVTLDRSRGGLGIGLALVRMLVELHRGSVVARSAGVAKGSEFEVQLPLVAVKAPSAPAPAPHRNTDIDPAAGRHIMLIEDNLDVQTVIATLCELWGHTVALASEGQSGIQLALKERPEVVLVDIGLPGIDGYEVARRLRATPEGRRMVLVAMTGYGAPEQRTRALESGFDLHLVKPVDPERLEMLLRDLRGSPHWVHGGVQG